VVSAVKNFLAEKLSPLESEMVIAAWFSWYWIYQRLKIMKTKVYALFLTFKKDKSDEYIQKISISSIMCFC
jgi:hypothetical protein